jgi:hypothetical protein
VIELVGRDDVVLFGGPCREACETLVHCGSVAAG